MNKKLRALLERKNKLVAQARAFSTKADAEGRDLSADERTSVTDLLAQIETLNGDIELERQLIQQEASAGGIDVSVDSVITGGAPAVLSDPKRGFESFGQFCHDVRAAGGVGGRSVVSERLQIAAAAPSTYGNESTGADGGYAVPPEFAGEIYQHSMDEDAILPLTDSTPVSGNGMAFPKDETTPWGSDGIRAYWEAEAAAANATKPKLGVSQMRLHKLFGLVPVTDELLADSSAMGSFVFNGLSRSIRWKANESLYSGSGVGQPLGIKTSAARVVISKEAGQAAYTLVVANVAKMFSRIPASSLRRAVWMMNSDCLPQLITMVLNNYPIFVPPGGLPNAPAGTLLGRPIMLSEHCDTVGDLGDIALVDWEQYRTIVKRAGIEIATSMHLYFDAGATAFRATFRLDGQPKIAAPISPAKGTNTKSPFVFLEARA